MKVVGEEEAGAKEVFATSSKMEVEPVTVIYEDVFIAKWRKQWNADIKEGEPRTIREAASGKVTKVEASKSEILYVAVIFLKDSDVEKGIFSIVPVT